VCKENRRGKKNRGFQPQVGNDEKVSSYSKIVKRRNINMEAI
jgi:hypothetical protein